MRRCEPIRRRIKQVGRDEEEKDVRQEIVYGELEDASWCLGESKAHAPVHRCGKRIGDRSLAPVVASCSRSIVLLVVRYRQFTNKA